MARKRQGGGRGARVGELIKQELSGMLAGGTIKDPRIARAMATITEVTLSPDLQHAKVFVSIFTEDAAVRATVLEGLESAAPILRRQLGETLAMRYTPELRFAYDGSIQYGAHIEALIAELHKK
jgi:ribosome-binding factor A